jgi:hypothetical protein
MEIKEGDLVWNKFNGYGTVLKIRIEYCAVYWYAPTNPTENTNYLKPDYHVKYVRQWKRNVEDKCSVSSIG